jgi:serine protease Do
METTPQSARGRRLLSPRSKFLGSVAGLAIAALVGGAAYEHAAVPTLGAPAYAAELVQQPGFADLVAKVKPAVIAVRVKMDASQRQTSSNENRQNRGDNNRQNRGQNGANPFQPGSPLDRFFRDFGFNGNNNNNNRQFGFNGQGDQTPPRMVTGLGSGFFITADGYAVTNNHVVDHAMSVQVTTDDGKIYNAKVIGTDPTTDIALIKVDGRTDFPHVSFAERAPRIGDWVVAVGNPFGLGGTVTAGIVSASSRDIGSGPYDYIQIDAPINKGNSGGPTFDLEGNVIGVNTAIFSPSGGSVGIGFDVPADTAKMVVAQIRDKGHVTRGYMGVQIQTITPEIADSLGLKEARGALVAEPTPNSPAAKAGVLAGDIITKINGTEVKDSRDVARKVGMMAPGSSVKFDLMRNGEAKSITLTLAEMPNQQQAKAGEEPADQNPGVPHLGLSLAPAAQVAGSGDKGLVVTGVEPEGPAADRGMRTGDVILDVGGKPVASVADVRSALVAAKSAGKHDVLMRVKTADATRFVALPLASS